MELPPVHDAQLRSSPVRLAPLIIPAAVDDDEESQDQETPAASADSLE
jgi:hypothetical protein